MRFSSPRRGGLAALGLAALVPAARAQTQDLFVSNQNDHTISRFAGTGPGTFSTTAATLSGSSLTGTRGLAFDARGDLFAANYNGGPNGLGSITEFAAGATPGTLGADTTALTGGGLNGPRGLTFDARGDLFAANTGNNTITKFAAGATPGTFGATTTLSGGGLDSPRGLAMNARGDLFAANFGTITEFASTGPGTFAAGTTLATGFQALADLAFDARGDLFAAYNGFGSGGGITEFASTGPGTFGAGTTFYSGSADPFGLAFDARGDLFTTNLGGINDNTVTEFAFNATSGTFGAAQTIETGLNGPLFLTFGPSVSAPVPEASTVVSLGLLLTLGLGGVVVAARKKRRA